MNKDRMTSHCLEFAYVYNQLQLDLAKYKHDPDAHNLCSAVVDQAGSAGPNSRTFWAYSSLAALPKRLNKANYEFVSGTDIGQRVISRGMMPDLHTEVRLLNHLTNINALARGAVVTFFSSRSVCGSCRRAIREAMSAYAGRVAVMAYEFKVEVHGTVTSAIYPIAQTPGGEQVAMNYES